jgi:hypothetical protein
VPKWNPINVCSYHLQEAGATPVQEIAFALATAIDVLDAVRDSGKVDPEAAPARSSGASPSSCNAGIRFIEEICQDAGLHGAVGPRSAASATASKTPACVASATACRSTRWA